MVSIILGGNVMNGSLKYNSRLIKALYFAADAHKNQKRKGSDMAYIVHPVEVAMILLENNMPEDLIIAGLLHDVLEDTDKSKIDIENEFGKKVLDLVVGASEELEGREKKDWKTRKIHTIQYLSSASWNIKCIACADKLSNIRSMLRDFDEIGNDLWKRFNETKPSEQLWYYNELVKCLSDLEKYDFYIEFKNSVDTLAEKVKAAASQN